MRRQQRLTFARVGVIDPLSADDYEAHGGLAGLRAGARAGAGRRRRRGHRLRAARPRRRRLPHRASSGRPCSARRGPAEVRLLQRRRGRQRHVRRPDADGGRPVHPHRGHDDRGARRRGERGLHLHPLRVPRRGRHRPRGDRDRARPQGWLGERTSSAPALDVRPPRAGRRRRLHLRRGDLHAGEPGGQARHGPGRSRRSRRSRACSASRRWSTTCCRWRPSRRSWPTGRRPTPALGTGRSRGTSVFQLGGNIARGGVFETAFGITLGELVHELGGGTRVGPPACGRCRSAGRWAPTCRRRQFDLPMDYEAFAAAGAMVGHGGIVVFDDTVDMAGMARFAMEFCAEESCGKCTPCRVGVGARRRDDRPDPGRRGPRAGTSLLLDDLCELMTDGSLCAMGGLTPMPVRSAAALRGRLHRRRTSHDDPASRNPTSAHPPDRGAATVVADDRRDRPSPSPRAPR